MKPYRLTDTQLNTILDACKPVPYMVVGGMMPRSPQHNANDAWQSVAAELGCRWDTIRPADTGDQHDILAEPIAAKEGKTNG